MPWIGDPWLIPLAHVGHRYGEACRFLQWQAGKDDTPEAIADRDYWRGVERLRKGR